MPLPPDDVGRTRAHPSTIGATVRPLPQNQPPARATTSRRDVTGTSRKIRVNTHLEAFDATARSLSVDLILQRAAEDFDPDLPVVLTGDFNEPAAEGRNVYDTLVTDGPYVDTWEKAVTRSELFGTFHGYNPLTPGGDRIDWVLTTPDVVTRHAEIDTYSRRGQLPSDHLPVVADLVLPAPVTS